MGCGGDGVVAGAGADSAGGTGVAVAGVVAGATLAEMDSASSIGTASMPAGSAFTELAAPFGSTAIGSFLASVFPADCDGNCTRNRAAASRIAPTLAISSGLPLDMPFASALP